MKVAPLVTFAALPAAVKHLEVDFGDFSATDVAFTPVSEQAKEVFAEVFGRSVTSVRIRKSRADEFHAAVLSRCEQ